MSKPTIYWTPDPFLAIPDPELMERMGPEWVGSFWKQRENAADKAKRDPLRFGHELATWSEARALLKEARFLLALGGNGSAKTMFLARAGMEVLTPEIKIARASHLRPRRTELPPEALWLSNNETGSLTLQRYVFRHLPEEVRPVDGEAKRRSVTTRINFNPSSGFGNRTFSLPSGAIGTFGTYHQWYQDDQCFEGLKLNFIGLDEDAPLRLVETLYNRLFERDGIMVQGFTAIDGITPTIREMIKGAKTVKSQRAELLPANHQVRILQDWPEGHLPYVQKAVRPKTWIMHWPTKANPGSNYADRVEEFAGQPTETIERRFYGFARNTVSSRFPIFGETHLVTPDDVPKEGSNYHVLDLAEARNFCMIWVRVCADGMAYVYDEWPDVDTMGLWAVPSDKKDVFDGEPGPAQVARGYSIEEYKELILRREGWREEETEVRGQESEVRLVGGVPIERRLIDPRAGNSEKAQVKGGALTVIEMFSEEQDRVWARGLDFYDAKGKDEAEGIQALNNLFSFKPNKPLVWGMNHPRLMVSRKCENFIWAMTSYTGHDGQKAACKDFVDLGRYFATENCAYYPPRTGRTVGVRGGYGNRRRS